MLRCICFGLYTNRIDIPLGFLLPFDFSFIFPSLWAEAFPESFALAVRTSTAFFRYRITFIRFLVSHAVSDGSLQVSCAPRHCVWILFGVLWVLGPLRALGPIRIPFYLQDGIFRIGIEGDATSRLVSQCRHVAFSIWFSSVFFLVTGSGRNLSLLRHMSVYPDCDFFSSFFSLFSLFRQGLGSPDRSDQVCLDFSSSRLKFFPDSFAFFCDLSLGGIWRAMVGRILNVEAFSMANYRLFLAT